jgi:hypothetical protein
MRKHTPRAANILTVPGLPAVFSKPQPGKEWNEDRSQACVGQHRYAGERAECEPSGERGLVGIILWQEQQREHYQKDRENALPETHHDRNR